MATKAKHKDRSHRSEDSRVRSRNAWLNERNWRTLSLAKAKDNK